MSAKSDRLWHFARCPWHGLWPFANLG
jgi:hypothetical protein